MSSIIWSIIGGVLGAALAFLVNVLTHRVTKGEERHLAWEDRTSGHVDETRYTVQMLTRDLTSVQAALTEMRRDQAEDQIRLRALEDKMGVFWRSVEDNMSELLKGRAPTLARQRRTPE